MKIITEARITREGVADLEAATTMQTSIIGNLMRIATMVRTKDSVGEP